MQTALAYDILALDLDGTVLGPGGTVSDANITAIARARDAGLRVTICTGRGLIESTHILDAIDQGEPVVVAGGSILAEPTTGNTIHRFAMDPRLIAESVDVIVDAGFPALVLKDPAAAGYDYAVVTGNPPRPLDPVTEWWFATLKCRVRLIPTLDDDEHPEHTVRVGACARERDMHALADALQSIAAERGTYQHFGAVVAPDEAMQGVEGDGDRVDILEVFDAQANKWNAIEWLAAEWGLLDDTRRPRVAAIGDEVNDVEMIQSATCGIAMGNAVPAVKSVANHISTANSEDGVAHAIDAILDRRW